MEQLVNEACALARQVLEHAFGPERQAWMDRLLEEQGNLNKALDWLYRQGETERGIELSLLLEELWFEDDFTSQGRAWFERFLAQPAAQSRVSPALRAQALDLAGALALNQADYPAARALQEQGLAILRKLDDPAQIGFALIHLAHLVGFVEGRYAAAEAMYQEALDLLQTAGHSEGIAHAYANLGSMAILQGRYQAALEPVRESLQRYRELDNAYCLAQSVWRAAGILAGLGQPAAAVRLGSAAAAQMATVGVAQPPVYQQRYDAMLAPAYQGLGEAAQAAVWAEGQAWSLQQAVEAALQFITQATRLEQRPEGRL